MWLAEQYVYMNKDKYEEKGNYADCSINSPEKQRDGSKKYSRFFCRFVGAAHDKIASNPNIRSFKIKMGLVTRAPYTNADGQKTYPKYEKVIIMDVDEISYDEEGLTMNNSGQGRYDEPLPTDMYDDDDVPF